MTFQIYHAKEPTFLAPHPAFNQDNFELVAELECEDLEEAYFRSNNVRHSWVTNECVTWVKPNAESRSNERRSTSVGDVVVDHYGVAHRVEMAGFTVMAPMSEFQFDQEKANDANIEA